MHFSGAARGQRDIWRPETAAPGWWRRGQIGPFDLTPMHPRGRSGHSVSCSLPGANCLVERSPATRNAFLRGGTRFLTEEVDRCADRRDDDSSKPTTLRLETFATRSTT